MQGLPFRGNDESENSTNQGNFLELLKFIASNNEEIRNVVLGNAPENLKLTSPDIQRDIINAAAFETTKAIILDMGDDLFSILVDECRDVSVKDFGCVIERFLGLVHVRDTSATSLLKGIKSLFSNYGLSIASLRGQGYDGASNMRGEFHGLKSLILKENSCAYYIHCFAHQLQLTLVAVAKKHLNVCSFFNTITRLCNVIRGSCKRRDMLREKQMEKVMEGLSQGVIETRQGLNQEMTLKRPEDTRWGYHFGTLINLLHLFSSVIEVLEFVGENGNDDSQRTEAIDLIDIMLRFEFLFVYLKFYRKKDQNIVNAMHLVKVSKCNLQQVRDDGWESLLKQVIKFCGENNVSEIDMQDTFIVRGRSRHRSEDMKNLHNYRVELFYSVIDM
ncbi:hypothetical protein K2173_018744 [Erythroxylum novogranatense]|uniref:DUF4371 domain-containing protein n=1 Tax=Erythroxylum novogranatense TaxID=1862640 RepID=A0AAV8SB47_9ROSI|nr:hypothetical protein K2173_018744 [Erythroxylum novogranatense]